MNALPAAVGLIGIATALALTGCGRADDIRDGRTAAQRFTTAVEAKDGHAACRWLSRQTRQSLEQQEKRSCADAVTSIDVSSDTVLEVEVFETGAAARMLGGDTVFLDDTPAGWRVSAAGCRPQQPGRPYDCEVES